MIWMGMSNLDSPLSRLNSPDRCDALDGDVKLGLSLVEVEEVFSLTRLAPLHRPWLYTQKNKIITHLFILIYLRSIAKQVIPTYIYHSRPLIPDGIPLIL